MIENDISEEERELRLLVYIFSEKYYFSFCALEFHVQFSVSKEKKDILKNLKGIVHSKMIWLLSANLQGFQDVGDFVSSVEHKQRFLTQTVAVCQSYYGSQVGFEGKKIYTDKTKLNPASQGSRFKVSLFVTW